MEDNEQLKYLYERYLHNECSKEELQAFFKLVNTLPDDAHIAALLSRTWEEGDWQQVSADKQPSLHFPVEALPLRRRNTLWWKAAAVVAGIGLLVYGWRQTRPRPVILTEKTTTVRQQLKVVLPDSSVVWLHAASKLRYPEKFSGNNREVYLEGKAFFEVRTDQQHPFLVHSGGLTTTVLGTAFNVDAYDHAARIAVTVTSGSVKVSDSLKVLDVLLPAQQISYDARSGVFAKTVVDTASLVAWKSGKIKFEEKSMGTIAAELERWYGVEFRFSADALRYCRCTGSFSDDIPLEKLLDVICTVNNIQYKVDDKQATVTFTGKGCPQNKP